MVAPEAPMPTVVVSASKPPKHNGQTDEVPNGTLALDDRASSISSNRSSPGHRTHNGSSLDLTDASISPQTAAEEGQSSEHKDAPSIVLPHQQAEYVSHIALDIGGSLIKLIYFSPDPDPHSGSGPSSAGRLGGRLHFVKFETRKIDEAMEFIRAKGLHELKGGEDGPQEPMRVKATGGGAHRFADAFAEKLGVILEKEDEMECVVAGCNFLLKAIRDEAFTFEQGEATFVTHNADSELFPYLLVNIGSGVSMLKVDGDGHSTRVSGSSLGGGTFWGLCRLLTRCKSFDEMLELSMRGDNTKVDMLVGDIYGNRDYSSIGLSATTIASSFGKVVSENRDLEDCSPADIALALCRMVSYNIGHLAYLNAKRYNLQRVFFGGFFIRGHPYTMETISFAIRFWSKGEMAAMFLRHEGFLGAVGAFLKIHPMAPPQQVANSSAKEPRKVRARFVERYPMGAPFLGGEVQGPAIRDLNGKVSWVEKFLHVGSAVTEAARSEHDQAQVEVLPALIRRQSGDPLYDGEPLSPAAPRLSLHVGVLHYQPSAEPFPLLEDPVLYEPCTLDLYGDAAEMRYWLGTLIQSIPTVVAKAIASEGGTPEARRRAAAFARALAAHLTKLAREPHAYGRLGLADLLEMREECLREFGFQDVYRLDKAREGAAALEVLPDLLAELDALPPAQRLTSLIEGVLAANIFDWGAAACVELYQNGTILEIYRDARARLSRRPWRVDGFDALAADWFSRTPAETLPDGGVPASPFRRVIMFMDNAGADAVLGMVPLARELLRMGAHVVLAANALPAINDITTAELRELMAQVAAMCPIIKAAQEAALAAEEEEGGRLPPYPGMGARTLSSARLAEMGAPPSPERSFLGASPPGSRTLSSDMGSVAGDKELPPLAGAGEARLHIVDNGQGSPCLDLRRVPGTLADATVGTDLVVIEGMGRAIHTNYKAQLRCPSLKLALIKNQHLAEKLFAGNVYDCVCLYETPASRR